MQYRRSLERIYSAAIPDGHQEAGCGMGRPLARNRGAVVSTDDLVHGVNGVIGGISQRLFHPDAIPDQVAEHAQRRRAGSGDA